MTDDPRATPNEGGELLRAMRDHPTIFDFFQMVRLLSRHFPERARVGMWSDPSTEVARFRASTSLAFPGGEIEALDLPEHGLRRSDPPVPMTVNFLGLTGPLGVLPHLYTEHAKARSTSRDTAFADFLDIFNHRAISLFYRAWEQGRMAVSYESARDDRFLDHLLDLAGLGTKGLKGRLPVRDEAAGFFAGLLATRARPADGLARLVADYFEVPASVEQFIGEWRTLDARGQAELDAEGDGGRLGFGVLGDAGWDPQARVRLRLGPLSRAQFDAFVPGGAAHGELCALVKLYADDIVGVDAQLVLARSEVTPCVLGVPTQAPGPRSPGLGRGTWLASRPLARDPDETTLRLC